MVCLYSTIKMMHGPLNLRKRYMLWISFCTCNFRKCMLHSTKHYRFDEWFEVVTSVLLKIGGLQCVRKCRLVTYLLTPWCRVLPEQLTGLQPDKKFPTFHGTRRFITALTSVHHLSLSWASPIQSIYPHPTSWRSILILSTHLRLGLPSGLFPSGFPISLCWRKYIVDLQ